MHASVTIHSFIHFLNPFILGGSMGGGQLLKLEPPNISIPVLSWGIRVTCSYQRSCDLCGRKSSDSMFRNSRISALLSLSNKVKPLILRKNPISAAWTRDLTFSFMIQHSSSVTKWMKKLLYTCLLRWILLRVCDAYICNLASMQKWDWAQQWWALAALCMFDLS